MIRTYEYRLYPRKRETVLLDRLLREHQDVYNDALTQAKRFFETQRKHQKAITQWPYFREWRKQAGMLANASSVQHTLRRLDKAYSAYFRRLKAGETPGYPRHKGSTRFKSVEYTYGDGCSLEYDEAYDHFMLYVQNIGNIKIKLHRKVPDGAVIKHVILKHKASGWYVYFMLELPQKQLPLPLFNCQPNVGIDMGLLRLLSLSDGTLIDNPRWFRQSLAELSRAQRRLSRAEKGSFRRKDKRQVVARLHEHVARIRRDFWHRLTTWLVKHYGLIALEDLELAFMTHNAHLSLSAHDAGLGLFQTLLAYKAVDAGALLVFVKAAYTSQVCSGCGAVVEKDLSERSHCCPNPECLLELDRDVNAARNILELVFNSAWIKPSGANVGAVKAERSLRSRLVYDGVGEPPRSAVSRLKFWFVNRVMRRYMIVRQHHRLRDGVDHRSCISKRRRWVLRPRPSSSRRERFSSGDEREK